MAGVSKIDGRMNGRCLPRRITSEEKGVRITAMRNPLRACSGLFSATTERHSHSLALARGSWASSSGCLSSRRFRLLRQGDVVAFLGGESVAQELEQGHVESLLAAGFAGKGVRYRNLGWEGDTVFEQPRDINFPGVLEQLDRVGVTVVFCQFGRVESMAGGAGLAAFVGAYEKLLDGVAKQGTRQVVLVTPPPFAKPASPLTPDLSSRNGDVKAYAEAVKQLSERRGFACIDLSAQVSGDGGACLTDDAGLRLSARGSALLALAAARQLGLSQVAERAGEPDDSGKWKSEELERLRAAVVEKNRLWFDYWRPMNWAFLGGNRTEQPSSRDPNDLNVRIFPAEMEKFVPLIERAEARVEELAKAVGEAR